MPRLAQGPAREEELVAEGRLPVDEHDFQAVLHVEELHAVVEQQRVAAHLVDGVDAAAHAVLAHQHDHVFQIARQHVRLVAGHPGVEQHRFPVGDDARLEILLRGEPCGEPLEEWEFLALVTAAQYGHAPTARLQSAGEAFHHGRFASAADGEVADADDEAPDVVLAENAPAKKKDSRLDQREVDEREAVKQPAQHRGALAVTARKDDIDCKLLEIFKPAAHVEKMTNDQ